MNSKLFFLTVTFLGIFFSCSNNDDNETIIDESSLIGTWNLTDVKVNNETLDDATTDHVLSFQNNEDYYRTYVTGTWKLKNNIIELNAVSDSYDWDIEIIELNSHCP